MSKLFTPDWEVFVYADSLLEAITKFEGEMNYLPSKESWEEVALDTVAHAREMIGFGGYDTTDFGQLIKWRDIEAPYIFTDIELEMELLYLD